MGRKISRNQEKKKFKAELAEKLSNRSEAEKFLQECLGALYTVEGVEVKPGSDFPIQNLPFGIFKTKDKAPRVGVAIGEYILDLSAIADAGLFNSISFDKTVFTKNVLNDFIALGKRITNVVRERISDLLNAENSELRDNANLKFVALVKQSEAEMLMPVDIPNYTDFYSSKEHATNVGIMFRDPANALLPNWKHLPVGYHGRASSIVISAPVSS